MKVLKKVLLSALFSISPSFGGVYVVHNNENMDITNLQVRIDLSNSTYEGYIKVLGQGGEELNFCYEQPNGECNTTPSHTIWVKVPQLPANGNAPVIITASPVNHAKNGDEVFDLYDGFGNFNEDWSLLRIQTVHWNGGSDIINGGYGNFGSGAASSLNLDLPNAKYCVSFRYWFIDSWDGEEGRFYINDNLIWHVNNRFNNHPPGFVNLGDITPSWHSCGSGNFCAREDGYLDVQLNYTGTISQIKFTSTLDQDAGDESFGFNRVKIWKCYNYTINNIKILFADVNNHVYYYNTAQNRLVSLGKTINQLNNNDFNQYGAEPPIPHFDTLVKEANMTAIKIITNVNLINTPIKVIQKTNYGLYLSTNELNGTDIINTITNGTLVIRNFAAYNFVNYDIEGIVANLLFKQNVGYNPIFNNAWIYLYGALQFNSSADVNQNFFFNELWGVKKMHFLSTAQAGVLTFHLTSCNQTNNTNSTSLQSLLQFLQNLNSTNSTL